MIFCVMVVLTIASVVIYHNSKPFSRIEFSSSIASVLLGEITAFMLIIIVCTHVGNNGTIRKYEEQYKGIIYKMQTQECRDEFGILNKEFVDEIQEWNMTIASGQGYQHDFWVGIFCPPIYDDFELIDLNGFAYKTQ